jgi:polyhydroxyalkanoate synthase
MRDFIDPFGIVSSCWEIQKAWLQHPGDLAGELTKLGTDLWALQIWQRIFRFAAQNDLIPTDRHDERFQDPIWTYNPYFDTLKEIYLLYSHWLEDAVYQTPSVQDKTRRKAAFWVREVLNAVAPTNFFWTNPVAIKRFLETGGWSLVKGFENFMSDVAKANISMVDETGFEVGVNLANSPGAVVYRNELVELIQYAPTTTNVRTVPIVLIAPWINKYYILDLNEKKSLVRYLVDQGFTVFITSWKNPGREMRNTTFEDYMLKGVLQAINVAKDICEVPQVHIAGYCIGGTIVAALLAWLNRLNQGNELPVAHATLFTTLLDFSQSGDIEAFVEEDSVSFLEKLMAREGYLDGKAMGASFRTLRANSLIWHYWVHNYLYGEPPPRFDILYWNVDTTRLPATMHSFYLREFYLNNRLAQPDALVLGGHPIDLSTITQPLYIVGTEQDHITPWKSTFKTCGLVNRPVRYMLATSGHILGIISPPVDPPKRRYWVGNVNGQGDPETWRSETEKIPGSWWEDWVMWLHPQCGARRKPPALGTHRYPRLIEAPGTYVLEQ